MASCAPVPAFDGKPENFRSFLQEVELWLMVTQLPASRRAPALALAMDKMPRELCLAIGVDELRSESGVEKILEVLKKHIAPDAHDSAFRDVVAFFGLRRVNHTLDEYLSLFQMALRRVEARFPVGATFPEIVVSSLCLQNAGLTTHQKSMVLTGTGGDPSLENMIKHMRRILQPCGVDLKHDALMVDSNLNIVNSSSTLINGL